MNKKPGFKTVELQLNKEGKLELVTDKKTLSIEEVNEVVDHMSNLAVLFAAQEEEKYKSKLKALLFCNICLVLIAIVSMVYFK